MNTFELGRQVVDRTVRTPWKFAQAPLRTAQLAAAEPGELEFGVALERPTYRLRRYESTTDPVRDVPVVIVYPFINDPSILDFEPDRSVIGGLLADGFPVYVFEWKDASPVARSLTLGDYVDRFLGECVGVARGETGVDDVHLLGYSTGAPLAAAYAALHPDTVRTLVLQGPPIDFDAGDAVGQLRTLAANQRLDAVAGSFDAVPTEVVESGFTMRKPVEYGVTDALRLWDRLDDEEYVEEVGRKLAWVADGPTLPQTAFRQFVEDLVLDNRLIENDLRLNDHRVDLDAVEMPVLLVLGRDDEFVPRESSIPFLDVVPSDDTAVIEVPTGHVGLSVAPEAHEKGWPRIREWLAERS